MRAVPTARHVLREAERIFKKSESFDHVHAGKELADAEELLEFVLGRAPDEDEEIAGTAVSRFRRLVTRRAGGEPNAYIIGHTSFHDLTLEVRPGAFIPRQSSEWMADQAIKRLRSRVDPVYVDLATGIGPVALVVAAAIPSAQVIGVDVAARPVAMAKRNAAQLGLRNVKFLRGDLFRPVPRRMMGSVDVVTIHPPYVGRREMRTLPFEILQFEPEESLTDYSPLGDRIVRRVVEEAPTWLRPGGWLLVEVSPDRSRDVATIVRRAGFRDVRSTKGGVEVSRVVVGRT
ncbi:MAG TPA: HemK/PrmC family methyltransferase [Actinomycetota bacterium]